MLECCQVEMKCVDGGWMSRRKRYGVAGLPQHIVQRGNNRQACFFQDSDYLFYLECLRDASDKHGCEIHAYVLMTNHVHVLAAPHIPAGISRMIQSVGRRYVQYINWAYKRTGTLWEGRYKASLIESERYFLSCCRYIEDNPVRAGIVTNPGEYRWSSYRHHVGEHEDNVVKDHPAYLALGESRDKRAGAYRDLYRVKMEERVIQGIRDSLQKDLVLGGERFQEEIEKMLQRRVRPGEKGRPRREACL